MANNILQVLLRQIDNVNASAMCILQIVRALAGASIACIQLTKLWPLSRVSDGNGQANLAGVDGALPNQDTTCRYHRAKSCHYQHWKSDRTIVTVQDKNMDIGSAPQALQPAPVVRPPTMVPKRALTLGMLLL